MPPAAISRETFSRVLFDLGIPYEALDVADVAWLPPAKAWLRDKFCPQLRRYLKRKGLLDYVPEANDCDDFADEGVRLAKRMHARMVRLGKAPRGTAFAVGRFWYRSARQGAHAIIVALVRIAETTFELVFIEPQTQRLVELTRSEINSCFRASF
jgi:hypothetical protein